MVIARWTWTSIAMPPKARLRLERFTEQLHDDWAFFMMTISESFFSFFWSKRARVASGPTKGYQKNNAKKCTIPSCWLRLNIYTKLLSDNVRLVVFGQARGVSYVT
jgi:hypothetical protein